jgi:hypothetical protein
MALFPSAFGEYYGFTAFTTEHTKLTENAQRRLLSLLIIQLRLLTAEFAETCHFLYFEHLKRNSIFLLLSNSRLRRSSSVRSATAVVIFP